MTISSDNRFKFTIKSKFPMEQYKFKFRLTSSNDHSSTNSSHNVTDVTLSNAMADSPKVPDHDIHCHGVETSEAIQSAKNPVLIAESSDTDSTDDETSHEMQA